MTLTEQDAADLAVAHARENHALPHDSVSLVSVTVGARRIRYTRYDVAVALNAHCRLLYCVSCTPNGVLLINCAPELTYA